MLSPSIIRYLLPPPSLKHRKHSTVQHSAVNPRNKQQSKYAPIRAGQRRQADGVGSRQHVFEHIYYSSLCSQNERRNRNLLGLHKNIADGVWCDARRVCLYTALSLSVLSISFIHGSVWVVFGTTELLEFASRYE